MCDTYDVCRLYSEGKLTKLNVVPLRHFCIFSSMDVDGLSQQRKAPYRSLIPELVLSCTSLNVRNSMMNFIDQFVDFLV